MNYTGNSTVLFLDAAERNDTETIRYFVEKKHIKLWTYNADEQTAAHIAVKNNNIPLLRYLLDKDPLMMTYTEKEGLNILIQAVEQGSLDIIKFLIEERGESLTAYHNCYYGNTAVHWSALRNQMHILRYFLEDQGVDVNIPSDFGETPLFLAAEKVNLHIVKYLIEKRKARVNIIDKNNNNVLYISARIGDLSVPRYILDELNKNINLNFRDFFGETILIRAVKFCHRHFAQYLIEEKGVDVNIPDMDGKTALHHAAETGNLTIVKYLCENGAFTDAKDDFNDTASYWAGSPEVVNYLWEVTPKSSRHPRSVPPSFRTSDGCGVARILSWSSNLVGRLGRELVPSKNEISSQFESILTVAGAIFRYSTVAGYVHRSPSDLLRSRMDPVAAEAVQGGF